MLTIKADMHIVTVVKDLWRTAAPFHRTDQKTNQKRQ